METSNDIVKIEDAARALGMSPTQVRNLMRTGRFDPPIGRVIKAPGKPCRYRVFRPMLDRYMGKESK